MYICYNFGSALGYSIKKIKTRKSTNMLILIADFLREI